MVYENDSEAGTCLSYLVKLYEITKLSEVAEGLATVLQAMILKRANAIQYPDNTGLKLGVNVEVPLAPLSIST